TEAMNLGDAAILEHVLARRASLAALAPQIMRSVARRRADALAQAFARHDHASVRRIFAMLPKTGRSLAVRIKAWVSQTPGPLRDGTARTLLALGTIRARARP
ncbi:MAG: hypothetical protein NTW56_07990, partial [Alphaproteobacteria bacterium]|nr:hypothetical protein [Alphaproteobacteria bacterium]